MIYIINTSSEVVTAHLKLPSEPEYIQKLYTYQVFPKQWLWAMFSQPQCPVYSCCRYCLIETYMNVCVETGENRWWACAIICTCKHVVWGMYVCMRVNALCPDVSWKLAGWLAASHSQQHIEADQICRLSVHVDLQLIPAELQSPHAESRNRIANSIETLRAPRLALLIIVRVEQAEEGAEDQEEKPAGKWNLTKLLSLFLFSFCDAENPLLFFHWQWLRGRCCSGTEM